MDPSAVIEGKITFISNEITSGNFKSKNIVVLRPHESNTAYDNNYEIQVRSDRYALLDKFKVGSMVKASINIQGKRWMKPGASEPMYFKTLSLWKLESLNASTQEFVPEQSHHPQTSNDEPDENLPF